MEALDRLTAERQKAGKPVAVVDLALHLGEVLYGNVGAVDRLDFTVIGPAVNEVARIETLCEPLGRKVLISAELAAAVGASRPWCRSATTRCAACASRKRSTGSISAPRRYDRKCVRIVLLLVKRVRRKRRAGLRRHAVCVLSMNSIAWTVIGRRTPVLGDLSIRLD
jgi:hypothetical protein